MNRKIFAAAMTTALLLFAIAASASPVFDPTVSNCTERNCSSIELGGTVPGYKSSALPWTMQVYAGPGECLRLEVTSQEADLEMRIVSPDGSETWLNDDSTLAPCPLCPLIAFKTQLRDGWYTVHIGEFGGVPVQANFTLAYGRYRRQVNANCTTHVPASVAPARASGKGSVSPAPDPASVPGR